MSLPVPLGYCQRQVITAESGRTGMWTALLPTLVTAAASIAGSSSCVNVSATDGYNNHLLLTGDRPGWAVSVVTAGGWKGTTYAGEVNTDGALHGLGVRTWADGVIVMGGFVRGRRHGDGVYMDAYAKLFGTYELGIRKTSRAFDSEDMAHANIYRLALYAKERAEIAQAAALGVPSKVHPPVDTSSSSYEWYQWLPSNARSHDDGAMRAWSSEAVAAWLRTVQCGRYAAAFQANHIDGDALAELGETHLIDLGIADSDRTHLLQAVRALSELDEALTRQQPPRLQTDISQHLPILAEYASKVGMVVELGVRGGVSSLAFLRGLTRSAASARSLVGNDIVACGYEQLEPLGAALGIRVSFVRGDAATIDLPSRDLTFFDTWHVYAQLRRELRHHAPRTRRYLLLHDVIVDGIEGESMRSGWDVAEQAGRSGFDEVDISKGLFFAIREFLQGNADWIVERSYDDVGGLQNGLLVLSRVEGTFRH